MPEVIVAQDFGSRVGQGIGCGGDGHCCWYCWGGAGGRWTPSVDYRVSTRCTTIQTRLAVVQPNYDRSRLGGRCLWGARSGVSWREPGARCGGGYPEGFIANRRASDSVVCRIYEH